MYHPNYTGVMEDASEKTDRLQRRNSKTESDAASNTGATAPEQRPGAKTLRSTGGDTPLGSNRRRLRDRHSRGVRQYQLLPMLRCLLREESWVGGGKN